MINKNYDDFKKLSCSTVIKDEKDGWYSFNETVFYGKKGGMPGDKGTINGMEVTGLKYIGDELYHKVDGTFFNPVEMEVDRDTRYINTAIQSAFHLLDGFYGRIGFVISAIGVMDEESQWYEVNTKELPEGHLEEVQEYLNKAIFDGIDCELSYFKGSEYPDPAYRELEQVRVVKFGDLDRQPCGTLHVSNTSDIGSFVVLDSEKVSRGTRIYVTCNLITNKRLKEYHEIIKSTASILHINKDAIVKTVSELYASYRETKKQLDSIKKELAAYKAADIAASDESLVFLEGTPADLRNIGQVLTGSAERIKLLYCAGADCVNFIIVSKAGKARDVFESLKSGGSINGGGAPTIVSGKALIGTEQFKELAERVLGEFI